jgi:amino acid transporter
MRLVKFVAYLFYRYYSVSWSRRRTPYFSTLLSLTILCFLHLLQIFILLIRMNIIPMNNSGDRMERLRRATLLMLPIFFVFLALIRKSKLKLMRYDERKVKKANILLVLYIALSIGFTIMTKLLCLK